MDFENIYATYGQKIFRLCMGYVNDADLAKDLTQETFIKVWQNLSRFRGDSSVGTWIFRIATNHCLRHFETEKRHPKIDLPPNLKEEKQKSIEPDIRLLYRFIAELPETDRIIISLELEDVDQIEIAKIVGLSNANVRVKIHRIKKKLTQKFKENENRDRL